MSKLNFSLLIIIKNLAAFSSTCFLLKKELKEELNNLDDGLNEKGKIEG